MGAARTYAEIVTTQALAALIGTHYRPTGHDAATTFGNLTRWIEARAAPRRWRRERTDM
jgi:hypothetical protein